MGAKGFYVSAEAHTVVVQPPVAANGNVATTPFHLKQANRACVLVIFGAQAAAAASVKLFACTDTGAGTAQPIGFDVFKQETVSSDVTGDRITVDGSGFVPTANNNTFYQLEIDTDSLPQGYPYLQVRIAGANGLVTVVAVLTGLRSSGPMSPSAIN